MRGKMLRNRQTQLKTLPALLFYLKLTPMGIAVPCLAEDIAPLPQPLSHAGERGAREGMTEEASLLLHRSWG
ncbi:hypothetical protein MC7420_2956 [Coleofasciculus chthonoplastes PCC 7420]|uniref:Uncharacterized protein n=1 Tax=Coleofasciculus chthonoplastes PCC 7420 TaxID=118168 RepID=B4VK21_9CYAN|nr:hypothetical protein MC7420_2956 [Coleofasciculus chthonoplastes PCC 7420]